MTAEPRILDAKGNPLSVGDRVVAGAYFVGEYREDGSARTYVPVAGTVTGFKKMCLGVRFDGATVSGRPHGGVHWLPIDLMWRCPDLQKVTSTPTKEAVTKGCPNGSTQAMKEGSDGE